MKYQLNYHLFADNKQLSESDKVSDKSMIFLSTTAGDFSTHRCLWGCSMTNIRSKLVEDQLLKHNLSPHPLL